MRAGVYDEEVENYLSMLSDMEISKTSMKKRMDLIELFWRICT